MKFMLLFAGGDPNLTVSAPDTDAKMQQMKRWGDWVGGLAKRGLLVSGLPFLETGKIVTGTGVTEFRKGEDDFSGYAILEVQSEQEAVAIARTAPHIVFGGTTVVRPCLEVPH